MNSLFSGFSYNLLGLRYFLSHKQLWKYFVIPIIINMGFLFLLVSLYVNQFEAVFAFMTKPLGALDVADPNGFMAHLWDGTLWLFRQFLRLIFFLLSLILIFVVVFLFSSLVNAPFYEVLSEKVMALKGGYEDRPFQFKQFLQDSWYAVKIDFLKLSLFGTGAFFLAVLSWIPGAGIVFTIFGYVFASWVFALGVSTYPMVLKRSSFKEILQWSRKRKWGLVGLGLPATVPFLGLVVVYFQVIGGTLYYMDQQHA